MRIRRRMKMSSEAGIIQKLISDPGSGIPLVM